MVVAMLLSAETSSASVSNATSSHQHVLTMKIALHNKSQNAAVPTLVPATRTSAATSERSNVQKDTNKPSSHHTIAVQSQSALIANTQQQLHLTLQLHESLILIQQELSQHQSLSTTQPHQPSLPILSPQQLFVLMMKVLHDAMVNNGRSVNVNHAAASLQVLSNALSKLARPTSVKKVPIKSEHTTLMNVALLQHALPVHQKNAQNVHQLRFQLVNATKMLSADRLIQPAAATSTIVNATRTSASILPKKLAQLDTHEPSLIPVLAAQLLNVARPSQQLNQQLSQLHQPLPLPILQPIQSLQPLQSLSASMLKVVSDVTVKAGLSKVSHAQFTLASPSTISELPSEFAVTSELVARSLNVRLLMSSTNAVLSTHVKLRSARMSSVQILFQIVNTMKI